MFVNTSPRFSWKWIPMIVAAAIASAALAASALASPTRTVTIDTTSHTAQFGAVCSAGAAPTSATADWQEDAAKTTQALSVSGNLCLQRPGHLPRGAEGVLPRRGPRPPADRHRRLPAPHRQQRRAEPVSRQSAASAPFQRGRPSRARPAPEAGQQRRLDGRLRRRRFRRLLSTSSPAPTSEDPRPPGVLRCVSESFRSPRCDQRARIRRCKADPGPSPVKCRHGWL